MQRDTRQSSSSTPPVERNESMRTVEVELLHMEEGHREAIPVAPVVAASAVDSGTPAVPVIADTEPQYTLDDQVPCVVATELIPAPIPPEQAPQAQQEEERPAVLSATLTKTYIESSVGVGVQSIDGTVRITSIFERGIFAKTPFHVGDRVISINSVCCQGRNAKFVTDLIKKNKTLTIVVENETGTSNRVAAMATKPHPRATLGVSLKKVGRRLVIARISEDSLFANSVLNAGDTCLSINDVDCSGLSTTVAIELLRNCPKYVTIVTRTEMETGVVLAASQRPAAAELPVESQETQTTNDPPPAKETRGVILAVVCFVVVLIVIVVIAIAASQPDHQDTYDYSPGYGCNYVAVECYRCHTCYNFTTWEQYECCHYITETSNCNGECYHS